MLRCPVSGIDCSALSCAHLLSVKNELKDELQYNYPSDFCRHCQNRIHQIEKIGHRQPRMYRLTKCIIASL